jgi:transposase
MEDLATILARLAQLEQELAEAKSYIAELEAELKRRGKHYRPKANRQPTQKPQDKRKVEHRQHPGQTREAPQPPETEIQQHDIHADKCTHCDSENLQPTGEFYDHMQVDIPEPKLEYHRFRHHAMQCEQCGKISHTIGENEISGSHIGPHARLLACYARGCLGISLGKTTRLMQELFNLNVSRAGVLGHVVWGGKIFAPVVKQLLALLRTSPVVHADETGWRIDGKNVWAWCFSNAKLAVFLIRRHRSAAVIQEALGASIAGVLITDFYAAYNAIDCEKQKCLVHLLRELSELSEELPARCVQHHMQPLMVLFQDAIALAKQRESMSADAYHAATDTIYIRFGKALAKTSNNKHVLRIHKRLRKHVDSLFTFMEKTGVPADNNAAERDIRSVAAARADGGVNRTDANATSFANIKSIIRTCEKNALKFWDYGHQLLESLRHQLPPPLPLPINTAG